MLKDSIVVLRQENAQLMVEINELKVDLGLREDQVSSVDMHLTDHCQRSHLPCNGHTVLLCRTALHEMWLHQSGLIMLCAWRSVICRPMPDQCMICGDYTNR